jgi:hypothetical protein
VAIGVGTAVAILYGVALYALLFAPAVVLGLKGRNDLVLAGFLTLGVVWIVGMARLAQPNSWWARTFYGEDKLARARERYD